MEPRCLLGSLVLLLALISTSPAWAQPAPLPRAIIPSDEAPEAITGLFAPVEAHRRLVIDLPGATWLQVRFTDFRLGADGRLVVRNAEGQEQTFSEATLREWRGLSARFNGSELLIEIHEDGDPDGFFRIAAIIVGLPGTADAPPERPPQELEDALGQSIDPFIVRDLPEIPSRDGSFLEPEAICDGVDQRVRSNDLRVARVVPVGCTGWLIENDELFLTAGHCIGTTTETLEFNVPDSLPNGTTQAPDVEDQYRIDEDSFVFRDNGVGDDWAIFRVFRNTETGHFPSDVQNAGFAISDSLDPATIRVTGYGRDGGIDNQTQQTHAGPLVENAGIGADNSRLRHRADTRVGSSGSPIMSEDDEIGIGIHTHAGCTATGGANNGTGFGNRALWDAILAASRRILLAEGSVIMLRVHDVGTGFGAPPNRVDGEVVVQLDSDPQAAFGLTLRVGDDEAAHRSALDVLRDAMTTGRRVQVEYETTGPRSGRIIRVIQKP